MSRVYQVPAVCFGKAQLTTSLQLIRYCEQARPLCSRLPQVPAGTGAAGGSHTVRLTASTSFSSYLLRCLAWDLGSNKHKPAEDV